MRVLLVHNSPNTGGGADIVFQESIDLLRSNKVSVFTLNCSRYIPETENSFYLRNYFGRDISWPRKLIFFPLFFFNPFAYIKVLKIIKKIEPDLVHFHSYKGSLTSAAPMAAKRRKVKVFWTSHDYGLVDPHNLLLDGNLNISLSTLQSPFAAVIDRSNRDSYLLSLFSFLEFSIDKWVLGQRMSFDSIVCVSKFQKRIYSGSKYAKNNFIVLHNFSRLESTYRSKRNGQNHLLFAGRDSREKGLSSLLAVIKECPDVFLKIAGPSKPANMKDRNIEWLGRLSAEELEIEILKCKYLVIPSRWHENNSLILLEALSLGVPVITSNLGGSPEIIVDGYNGYLFDINKEEDLFSVIDKAKNINEIEYSIQCMNARIHYEQNFSRYQHQIGLMKLYRAHV